MRNSARLFSSFSVTMLTLGFTAASARAVWVDDFDNGDWQTNGTPIGWTEYAATSTSYYPIAGYDYPFVVEPAAGSGNPGTLGAGRDGEGWIELASAAGNQVINTTAPVPELNFFSGPASITFEHVNNAKYQNTELQTGTGGFSFVYSYLSIGSTQGRTPGAPSLSMDDGISIDLLGLAGQIRLRSKVNGAMIELGTIDFLVDNPSSPTQFGAVTVSNMMTFKLDLDPVNVTLTVIDETTGLTNVLTAAHGITLADWNAGTDGAYIGLTSDSQTNQVPTVGPRASTLSVGRIVAIPEPASLAMLALGGLVTLARRRAA